PWTPLLFQAEPDRSSRNSRLRSFYQQGQVESDAASVGLNVDPCDIDGAGFDPEVYLSKLLQEQPLTSLMAKEQQMVDQIRQLDSDMQTLVYDNYSKFISATDTIRKMKSDFHRMEQEMNNLAESVSAMSQQAADVRQHVGGKRAELKRLAGVSALLHKLQYLLDLPARLTELRREGAHQQAIRAWQQADRVLSRYADLPSFRPIRSSGWFSTDLAGWRTLHRSSGLADPRMQRLLGDLEAQAGSLQDDVLQFVDQGCNHLVSELCILIAVFGDIFPSPESRAKLEAYTIMRSYLAIVSKRFCLEARESGGTGDSLLVRACDRFHRKLQAMHRLVTEGELSVRALAVVCDAAAERAGAVRAQLDLRLTAALSGLRSQLATAGARSVSLPQLMAGLLTELVDAVKAALAGLQAFLATDVSFSLKPAFRERFCVRAVRQELLAGFLNHQATQCARLAQLSPTPPPLLLLLLSRYCLDFRNSSLHYLCTLADEQFLVPESPQAEALVTPVSELSAVYSDSAAELLQAYVCASGGTLAGMLRKSVDARDWLQGIEPRSVRAVVKRVVEDLAGIDASVSSLYDEAPSGGGGRGGGDRSSDSSASRLARRPLTAASRSQWSATPSTLGNSLLHRLFSDKVDLLGPAEFGRASVVSGVVRLALKTLLECVRLKTFGRYGLQQVQVDCHYLHAFLWRYVSDDSVVHFLLEEILASAAHRCIDPVSMEQSVVELIVERD
uniref:Vacuolar protein sorting-associated protein 51 homolog n=1 Tax=Macrostomum lignano TaxID=282301 RepID=A0A1I8G024_9PLAT